MTHTYVAECPLCRTKFETNPGSCPVCGGTELRAIHERMDVPTPIPVPTRKTPPPAAVRPHRSPTSGRAKAGVRKPVVPSLRPKKASLPPRGPDGRFLPRKKAVATPATPSPAPRAAEPVGAKRAIPAVRAAEALRRASGAPSIPRVPAADAAARLREMRIALAKARCDADRAKHDVRRMRDSTKSESVFTRITDWLIDLIV